MFTNQTSAVEGGVRPPVPHNEEAAPVAPTRAAQDEIASYLREASMPKAPRDGSSRGEGSERNSDEGAKSERTLFSRLTFGIFDRGDSRKHEVVEKRGEDTVDRMARELPEHLREAKEEVKERAKFSLWAAVKSVWGAWEKFAEIAPSPWSSVIKFGIPAAATTSAVVFYQAIVQVGLEALKLGLGWAEPLAIAAALLVPALSANKILNFVEKVFRMEPITGWHRQAILRPAQGMLFLGAAIFMQTMDFCMLTYGIWAGAAVATGYLAHKFLKSPHRLVWPAVAAAVLMPWSHYLTQRTYDVTVLSAGPDPEVAAWNIGTDLSVHDHWKGLSLLGEQAPPSGKAGMVLINRDVPLYLPPHRHANAFNAEFSTLVGKQVRVTTIGSWLKFISPKLQPTIVKYEILGADGKPISVQNPMDVGAGR